MKERWLFQYGVPIAVVLFGLFAFGFSQSRDPLGVGLLLSAATYVTIIFLFAGIPSLVFHGQTKLLVAGIVLGIGLSSLFLQGTMSVFSWTTTWPMLIGSTVIAGSLARKGQPFSVAYASGLIVVMLLSLAQCLYQYEGTSELARLLRDEFVGNARMQMTVAGYTPDQVDEIAGAFTTVLNAMIRLMPVGFVLGAGIQYSMGYLWFSQSAVAKSGKPAIVPPFATWKAPFGLAIVVLIGSALRLLGGDGLKIVADNLLVGAGVIYLIMGMALIESFMRRAHFGWIGRLFVYVALFLAQIIGLLVVALLGFIDSYVDWRARAQRSIDETV